MHFTAWHAIGLIAAGSLVVTMQEVTPDTRFTLETLSLAAGVTALSLMGAAAFLGGRFELVESLFGGLDRVYITHKWLGVGALAFASFHFAFAAEHDAWITMPIVEPAVRCLGRAPGNAASEYARDDTGGSYGQRRAARRATAASPITTPPALSGTRVAGARVGRAGPAHAAAVTASIAAPAICRAPPRPPPRLAARARSAPDREGT